MQRHSDGSVTLTRDEVETLERDIERWERGSYMPGNEAGIALVDLGCDVREILHGSQETVSIRPRRRE